MFITFLSKQTLISVTIGFFFGLVLATLILKTNSITDHLSFRYFRMEER